MSDTQNLLPEIPSYMGTREQAYANLVEKARAWRETRQPAFLTASEIKSRDAVAREHQLRCAEAALLWLWFEEQQPATPPGDKTLREALEAASHALRSYQYGNASTELAKAIADKCDAALSRATKGGDDDEG